MMDQKDYYNEKSQGFERGLLFERTNRNHIKKIKKLEELLDITDSSNYHLLEVGLGTGIHANYILGRYQDINYTGVDISAGMIVEAREKLGEAILSKNVNLLVADGEKLPFDHNSFDAAYISGSLHHFPHPYLGLSELLRVLKPGGRFALMEPNWLFPTNLWAAITNRLERNILKVNRQNLKKWASQLRIDNFTIRNFIYTPPIPKSMGWIYDDIDDLFSEIPFVAHFSIMIYMSAQKRLGEVNDEWKIVRV